MYVKNKISDKKCKHTENPLKTGSKPFRVYHT